MTNQPIASPRPSRLIRVLANALFGYRAGRVNRLQFIGGLAASGLAIAVFVSAVPILMAGVGFAGYPEWLLLLPLAGILALAFVVGRLIVCRLHDINRRGLWSALPWLTAIIHYILLSWCFECFTPALYNSVADIANVLTYVTVPAIAILALVRGTKGPNRFGPEPESWIVWLRAKITKEDGS
jgi:uncharacterized membrane protein YhaH (DUF805 family)